MADSGYREGELCMAVSPELKTTAVRRRYIIWIKWIPVLTPLTGPSQNPSGHSSFLLVKTVWKYRCEIGPNVRC